MIHTQPIVDSTGLYGVMATAEALRITKETVRQWTKSGLLIPGYNWEGRKYYTGDEIIKAWRKKTGYQFTKSRDAR